MPITEKKKILIIDDEVDFTQVLRLNLEAAGKYEVRTENRGAYGLASARIFKPDLILLDIRMPDMEGSNVVQKIKNDEALKDTPVVFLTAVVKKEDVKSDNDLLQGYPFLSKPVTVKEIIDCIEKNIRK